jgi:spermidine synthase
VGGSRINLDDIDARLKRPEYAPVARSLQEVGMNSAVDLFATYGGQAPDFNQWLSDAQINRDRNLRLQYLAGQGLNLYQADVIYAEMLPHAKEPTGIFEGSDGLKEELLDKIRVSWNR